MEKTDYHIAISHRVFSQRTLEIHIAYSCDSHNRKMLSHDIHKKSCDVFMIQHQTKVVSGKSLNPWNPLDIQPDLHPSCPRARGGEQLQSLLLVHTPQSTMSNEKNTKSQIEDKVPMILSGTQSLITLFIECKINPGRLSRHPLTLRGPSNQGSF